MRILVFGDVHWSSYSSIVRSNGKKFSTRLEKLIQTMYWIENIAFTMNCDRVVCLGDFFDKADLNSSELTALDDIVWLNDTPHTFLVGNHEMGRNNLQISSAHVLGLGDNLQVVDSPAVYNVDEKVQLCFLPYMLESERKPLDEYFPSTKKDRIIFSHNDIKGIQMGKFVSQEGFSVEEIESFCRLFVNGHLHNGTTEGKNIINLGNITGQNFSEDAFTYRHSALIIDTDTFEVQWIENPHAFNFYKLDFTSCVEDRDDAYIQSVLESIGPNAVVTIKVKNDNKFIVDDLVSTMDNIIECRVVVDMSVPNSTVYTKDDEDFSVDHIQQFSNYIKSEVGTDKEVLEELLKITGGVV